MAKRSIKKVEFYITNVCNLTCEYCNRFNNLNFKGWQDWNDYKDIYARWSDLLEIDQIVVMGGEPLLNPSICDWAKGLSKTWGRFVQILSNGTRINHVKNFYDTLRNHNVWIGVTLHNLDHAESIIAEVERFLQPPVNKIFGKENNTIGAEMVLIDSNGIRIPFWITDSFLQNAILRDNNGAWTLHDSDPVAAHEICVFAQAKSYHFIRGKLYKCGPVALLPELDTQIGLQLSQQDRILLNSYKPLTLENFDSYHKEFFDKLDDPIPQCKFCPSYGGGGKIYAINKKDAVS